MVTVENSQYRYSGRLEEQLLPEILHKIDTYKVPGIIQIQNGFTIKKLFIKKGLIIFAISNQKQDRLGEYLIRKGIIIQEQFDEATRRLKMNPHKRFGRILVEMNILTPHQLFMYVLEQIEEIVLSLFEWSEGDVTFIIGDYRDDELIKLNLPIPRAIMKGVHRLPDISILLSRLPAGNRILYQHPRLKYELHELGLLPQHRRLIPLINGQLTLNEILERSPLERDVAIRILYGLYTLNRIADSPIDHLSA